MYMQHLQLRPKVSSTTQAYHHTHKRFLTTGNIDSFIASLGRLQQQQRRWQKYGRRCTDTYSEAILSSPLISMSSSFTNEYMEQIYSPALEHVLPPINSGMLTKHPTTSGKKLYHTSREWNCNSSRKEGRNHNPINVEVILRRRGKTSTFISSDTSVHTFEHQSRERSDSTLSATKVLNEENSKKGNVHVPLSLMNMTSTVERTMPTTLALKGGSKKLHIRYECFCLPCTMIT